MRLKILALAGIPLLFFFIAFWRIGDYGISWDEPIHFYRGQAYLYYILTGKVRFDKDTNPSYYQNNQLPAEYWLEKDDGHPPLNGILASLSNLIFYQKLGVLGDIESYHLFNIAISTILVLVIVLFAWQTYGVFAGLVAGIVVSTYPLFFAESHFNIKDPVQSAFFALTIWAFWRSLQNGGWRWVLVAAMSAGLALGTKFNILFSPLIVIPYLIARYHTHINKGWLFLLQSTKKIPKSYIFTLVAFPFIVVAILFATWPFLWQDPLANSLSIIRWYQNIGTGHATFGYFTGNGFNLFAPIWILVTTPPWVIILTSIGVIAAIKKYKEHGYAPLLWLLWFLIPIARVIAPNTTVYGGVRQIMEFLPAMALLSGLGANTMATWLHGYMVDNKKPFSPALPAGRHLAINLLQFLIILAFIPHLIVMVKLHPNQNVYFNFLIGGLPGAREKGVPYWGNSFGNAYWQAIQWLNRNAEQNAKIALIQGTTLNIPRIKLRSDLRFSNSFWSGIYRDGEYLIELTHNDKRFYPYAWEYVETFLEPVFEVKVDGVAIAKVWKNDLKNSKSELRKNEFVLNKLLVKSVKDGEIILDIGETASLTRLVILYRKEECKALYADVSTSTSGDNWLHEEEVIPANQLTVREKENSPFEAFFFPARETRFIKLEVFKNNVCALNTLNFKAYGLEY